jgi:hypothetical protein
LSEKHYNKPRSRYIFVISTKKSQNCHKIVITLNFKMSKSIHNTDRCFWVILYHFKRWKNHLPRKINTLKIQQLYQQFVIISFFANPDRSEWTAVRIIEFFCSSLLWSMVLENFKFKNFKISCKNVWRFKKTKKCWNVCSKFPAKKFKF